jgi:hypothetical protein
MKRLLVAGFGVLRAVVLKGSIFWDITSCNPLKVNRRFGGTCAISCYLLHAGFLLEWFYNPEDGGDIFFRNISSLSTDDAMLYPRSLNYICQFSHDFLFSPPLLLLLIPNPLSLFLLSKRNLKRILQVYSFVCRTAG